MIETLVGKGTRVVPEAQLVGSWQAGRRRRGGRRSGRRGAGLWRSRGGRIQRKLNLREEQCAGAGIEPGAGLLGPPYLAVIGKRAAGWVVVEHTAQHRYGVGRLRP